MSFFVHRVREREQKHSRANKTHQNHIRSWEILHDVGGWQGGMWVHLRYIQSLRYDVSRGGLYDNAFENKAKYIYLCLSVHTR